MLNVITAGNPAVFLFITVLLIGGAALLTGRALARAWRPIWQVVLSCLGLGLVDRFLVYALFDGSLDSIFAYLIDSLVITGIGTFCYRVVHVSMVIQQYPWLFERASSLMYRPRR